MIGNDDTDTIVFLTSPFNFQKIKNKKFKKIITFDYESHNLLQKNMIKHICSDELIEKKDFQIIEELCYEFTNWFKNTEFKEFLSYNKINLGSLFYPEFHFYIIPIIKKMVELKACKNMEESKYICSNSFFDYAKLFFPSVKPFDDSIISNSFLYDDVTFNLSKKINIKIKREKYQEIKKKSEKLLRKLSKLNKNNQKKKSVLFIEFDPIKYENLFSKLGNYSINPIFLNLRRPYFWNLNSFKIMNKTSGTIITDELLDDANHQKIIKNKKEMEKNFANIVDSDIIRKIFSFEKISFWKIIKKDFITLCEKRITNAIEVIELIKETFTKYHISEVVLWSENGFNEQVVIEIAKQNKIPINLMQHGIITDSKNGYNFNKFSGIIPLKSDRFFAWENSTMNYLNSCGIPLEKIRVVGSPLLDKQFLKKQNGRNKNSFILVIANGPKKITHTGYNSKFLDEYTKQIITICNDISKLNEKIVIHPHPFSHEFDIEEIIKKENPSIVFDKKSNIDTLVKNSKMAIIIGVSTVIYEVMIQEKPTVFIKISSDLLGEPNIIKNNLSLISSTDELKEKILSINQNDDFHKSLIKKNNLSLSSDFGDFGNSSDRILQILEKDIEK